jgi:hypothetical protein
MVRSHGHRCDGGNRTLPWSQLCDGMIDCYDRFDEQGQFCSQLKLKNIYFSFQIVSFSNRICINNLYSWPPQDDIRCDLACQMLHYVPC